jgi:hypothetical protein
MNEQELIKTFYEQIYQDAPQMRSYGWWLSSLPEPYRSQAIYNSIEEEGENYLFEIIYKMH